MRLFSKLSGKITVRNAVWIVAACVLAPVAYFIAAPQLITAYQAHAQVPVTPFTIHTELYEFDAQHPDGWLGLKETVARRSDGETIRINAGFGPDGGPFGMIRQIDSADGSGVIAYDDTGDIVRLPKPPDWLVAMRKQTIVNPPSNCVRPGSTLEGYDTIQGYRVAIVRAPQVAQAETRTTVWRAPDLGCAALQTLSEAQQPDGSYVTVAKTKLVSIETGEPDANLSEVASTDKAVMPSQAVRDEFAYLGRPWTAKKETEARQQDASYERQLKGQWGAPPKKTIYQNLINPK